MRSLCSERWARWIEQWDLAPPAGCVFGVLGMLVVDHGPWNKPKEQPAFTASYSSTGEAARAAGAKVMPTEPKLQVEPEPPMPKPVHPVNPAPQ